MSTVHEEATHPQTYLEHAADRHDAAAGGCDDAEFYEFFARSAEQRDRALPVRHVPLAGRTDPFEAWAGNARRTEY